MYLAHGENQALGCISLQSHGKILRCDKQARNTDGMLSDQKVCWQLTEISCLGSYDLASHAVWLNCCRTMTRLSVLCTDNACRSMSADLQFMVYAKKAAIGGACSR